MPWGIVHALIGLPYRTVLSTSDRNVFIVGRELLFLAVISSQPRDMNRRLLVLSILILPFLIASEDGVAEEQNKDRTGAPGSQNACNNTTCHTAGAFNPAASIKVMDQMLGTPVSEYVPGETYDLKFTVNSAGGEVFGFQATVVKDSNYSNAGTLQNPGLSTQLESVGGRHIIEHSSPNSQNFFLGEWVAPDTDVGAVTFYMSGIAANDSGSDSGDGYAGTQLTLVGSTTDINDPLVSVSTYLRNGNIFVEGFGTAEISLYSINGQLLFAQSANDQLNISLDSINHGLLILVIKANGKTLTQKFSWT